MKSKPSRLIFNKHLIYPFWSLFSTMVGASDNSYNSKFPLAANNDISKHHEIWLVSTKVISQKQKKLTMMTMQTTRQNNKI